MILGVHSATFVKNWHEDVKPYIHLCKKAGYKSVEVSLLGQTPSSAKEIAKQQKSSKKRIAKQPLTFEDEVFEQIGFK